MARHRRVDKKEVTLHLKTSVVKLYFETVVGEGRWDKEARQQLDSKYYLDEPQHDLLKPPDLSQTRLHFIEGWDMSGMFNTLYQLHYGARMVCKVLLQLYES